MVSRKRRFRAKSFGCGAAGLFLLFLLSLAAVSPGPALAAPPAFDLPGARAYARKHSPLLAVREAEVGIAAGEQVVSRAAMLPTLSLSGGYDYYKRLHGIVPGVFGRDQVAADSRLGAQVNCRYVAFAFGKNYFSYEGARRQVESREKEYLRTREVLSYQVSRGYYAVLTVRKTIAAAAGTVASLEALEKEIRQKFAVGRLPEVDLLKVQVKLAAARDDLARLRVVEENLVGELCRLMGYEGERPVFTTVPIRQEVAASTWNPQQLLSLAYIRREDLHSIETALEAVALRLKAVRASYFPEVALEAAANEQTPDNSDFSGDHRVGITVTMPLFDGLHRRGEMDKLQAEYRRLQARQRDKKLEISQEVHTAVRQYQEAFVRLAATRKAVEHGREVLKVEKLKYDYGRTTINFVLEAESSLLEAESLFYRAYYDSFLARDNISLAAGTLGTGTAADGG